MELETDLTTIKELAALRIRCSVYDHRPEQCRSFPHFHKKNVTSRLWGIIVNYSLCPIVFNVYEQLKQRMDWR